MRASARDAPTRHERAQALFRRLRDFVVGAKNEDRDLVFHPDLGLLEELRRDVLKGFADGLRGMEAAFFGGVEIVGAAKDALLGGGDAVFLGNLENPGDKIVFRQAVVGVAGENDELLFDCRRLLFVAGVGLGGEVHFLDDLAEEFGVELVLFENLGDNVDFDFRHKERGEGRTAYERG